jgi:hypothetical protein
MEQLRRAFESIAKVDNKMDFVTRSEKVTATIATDLTKAMQENGTKE